MKTFPLWSLKNDFHRKITLTLILAAAAVFLLFQVNLLQAQSQKNTDIEKTIPVADYNAELSRPVTGFTGCGIPNGGEIKELGVLPLPTTVRRYRTALFPVESSNLIVVADVADVQAHLTIDRTYMYTSANLKVREVLKSDFKNVPVNSSLEAIRCGGAVKFESGTIAKYYTDGFGFPQKNRGYVLFLGNSTSELYITTGFELTKKGVVPIDPYGNTVPPDFLSLSDYEKQDEKTFLENLKLLIKKSSGEPPGGDL